MAPVTEDTIRRLAAFKAEQHPVVTLYLDVDGRRWPRYQDCETRVERLVRKASEHVAANGHAAAQPDLERIEAFVHGGLDRSEVRGLAVFAAGEELWEVYPLPVPVRDQLVVNETPHVRQLETVVDNFERFGVLVADRQRARMFVFELGRLVEKNELFEQLPRHDDDGGEWQKDHVKAHVDVAARQHLKRAANVAFDVFKDQAYDHLILVAPQELLHEVEEHLHSYLQDRIAARLTLATSASEAEIAAVALEVEQEVERRKGEERIEQLREAIGTGNGVAGLADVLRAVSERRVETLLVSDGYQTEGWHCRSCDLLAALGRGCPVCGQQMELVDDVVEAAIERALLQACDVHVLIGNADLDVLGRVGAMLRY